MKKILALTTILCVVYTKMFGQSADLVKGTWLNDNKDVKIEIYKSGSKYFGKITWTRNMYEDDGKTLKKDSKNSDEQLRNRSIVNLVVLSNFSYDDGEWTGGEIYNPNNGKTYKSKMNLKGNNLEVRGYLGSPMFGKTTMWTRAS
jgi:uncharacterized protein (DUF2147 family)